MLWDEAAALIASRPGWRVLHGYSAREDLPRFHLDRFGEVFVATFLAPPTESAELHSLAALLARDSRAVVFKFRDERRRATGPGVVVAGDPASAAAIVVRAEGYSFEARPLVPLDSGAYPDAEPLRAELRAGVAGRVLNLFAYTCLFGVCARLGGARVVNVDLSRSHLRWGRRNYELNGLRVDERDFVAEDAHRYLRRTSDRFDRIVVDPPPFYRRGEDRRASEERLDELLGDVMRVAAPGATIHFLQCTARLEAEALRGIVESVVGRSVEVRTSSIAVTSRELAPTYKEARVVLA